MPLTSFMEIRYFCIWGCVTNSGSYWAVIWLNVHLNWEVLHLLVTLRLPPCLCYVFIQCCGSRSGIGWFLTPGFGIRDGKKVRSRFQDDKFEHPGSYFWELCISFWLKILKFFDADPDSGSCQPWIRDSGWKKVGSRILDPGCAINIRIGNTVFITIFFFLRNNKLISFFLLFLWASGSGSVFILTVLIYYYPTRGQP